jgi:undecaprenyl-diphosphatase
MSLLTAALLGVVQGLTEFLPISSSAHLILARTFFGVDAEAFGLAFDVACHVGTLGAVLWYFRREVGAMIAATPGALTWSEDPAARRGRLILIGTLPIVIVALLFNDWVEERLRTPLVCAVTLTVGGLLLLTAERLGRQTRDDQSIRVPGALLLGAAQASALIPGVSRSGATIGVGLLAGLTRESAARFSFLLGIPAILAAAAREGLEVARAGLAPGDGMLFLIGMATSGAVGYLTIRYFLRFVARRSLDVFAWYRLALAAATFLWLARHP